MISRTNRALFRSTTYSRVLYYLIVLFAADHSGTSPPIVGIYLNLRNGQLVLSDVAFHSIFLE